LENFFSKIDIIESRACSALAPINDITFIFDSFPPVEGEIVPKENFYPYFIGNDCKFSKIAFTIIYVLTGATNDPGLTPEGA